MAKPKANKRLVQPSQEQSEMGSQLSAEFTLERSSGISSITSLLPTSHGPST